MACGSLARSRMTPVGKHGLGRALQRRTSRSTGSARSLFVHWASRAILGCPISTPRRWGTFQVRFSRADCSPCPSRAQCTKAKVAPRILFLLSQPEHGALQTARQRQQTAAFREEYALRAGVESLMSQGMRAFDLRKARYIGCARTQVQHILIAVAINIVRLVAWWRDTCHTPPRMSAFARLATLA